MDKQLLAVTVMALERMDNIVLAAANNGLTGFGRLNERNLAYKPFLDASLIREDGVAYDKETLLDALSFEINRRVENKTFN